MFIHHKALNQHLSYCNHTAQTENAINMKPFVLQVRSKYETLMLLKISNQNKPFSRKNSFINMKVWINQGFELK